MLRGTSLPAIGISLNIFMRIVVKKTTRIAQEHARFLINVFNIAIYVALLDAIILSGDADLPLLSTGE